MAARKVEKAYNDKDALHLALYKKNHNYYLVTLTYHSPYLCKIDKSDLHTFEF